MDPRCLAQLATPDNAVRKQAEDAFSQAHETAPDALVGMLATSLGSNEVLVQHMAALLLRKCVGDEGRNNCWARLSPAVQAACKEKLLAVLPMPLTTLVRTQVELAVGKLGAQLIPKGEWLELLDILLQGAQADPRPAVRRSSIEIFSEIFSWLGATDMKGHLKTLLAVLQKALGDEDAGVRLAAMEAVLHVSCVLGQEAMQPFSSSLLPTIMRLLGDALRDPSNGDYCVTILDALVLTAEAQCMFYASSLKDVLSAMLSLATAGGVDGRLRHLGFEMLVSICEGMPKKIGTKHKAFIPTLLNTCVGILREFAPSEATMDMREWGAANPFDDEDEEFVDVMHSIVCDGVSRIAHALTGQAFYRVFAETTSGLLQSAAWVDVYTATVLLTHAAEGCSAKVADDLKKLVPGLVQNAACDNPILREASLDCLGQFCFDFKGTFQEQFKEGVLQAAIASLDDPVPRLRATAANLVKVFFNQLPEGDDDDAKPKGAAFADPFFDALVEKLLAVVEAPASANFLRQTALAAVAEVVYCASPAKVRAVRDALLPRLLQITRVAQGLTPPCPALVAEAIPTVSWAVLRLGSDALTDAQVGDVVQLLSVVHQTVTGSDDPRAEVLLEAYARLAECLGARFVPFLDATLPVILQRAGIENPGRPLKGLFENDLEDCITFPDGTTVAVNTALVNEKERGLGLLADFAKALGADLPPAARQEMLRVMFASIPSPYRHEVRVAAARGVLALVAHDVTLLVPFLEALLTSFHLAFQKPEGLLELLGYFNKALSGSPQKLSPEFGEPIAKGLLQVLRASVKRQEDDDSSSDESDEDDDDEGDVEAEGDGEDDDSDASEDGPEEKLQQRVAAAMETLMHFQPQCREGFVQHLTPGFLELIRDETPAAELALYGLISFLEKGIDVVAAAAPAFLAALGNAAMHEDCHIAACMGLGHCADMYHAATTADGNRAAFFEQAYAALAKAVQTLREAEESTTVAAAHALLKLRNDAVCIPVVLGVLPFGEEVDEAVEESARQVHQHVAELAAQQSPVLAQHAPAAARILAALAAAKDSCVVDEATARRAKQAVKKLR